MSKHSTSDRRVPSPDRVRSKRERLRSEEVPFSVILFVTPSELLTFSPAERRNDRQEEEDESVWG